MRWIYKIWGGYNGFRPATLPRRMQPGGEIDLGWAKYADVAEVGDEVWVWFQEGSRFTPGVYAKGIIESLDPDTHRLILQTQEHSTTTPLTTSAENRLLEKIVAARGRQVFVLPEDFRRFEGCTSAQAGAPSCGAHQCDYCTYWVKLPIIRREDLAVPELLRGTADVFAPAYWVIANRSFVYKRSDRARPGIRRSTDLFYRFKTGEAALAYPLAKGMVAALAAANRIEADAIIPIPLSPEKERAKEINRTRLLADNLSALIKVPVVDALCLAKPIGKRAAQSAGQTLSQFRTSYESLLRVDVGALGARRTRLILVDDVCTYGNTLAATIQALRAHGVGGEIVACTAGQMTIQDAVKQIGAVLKPIRQ